MQESYQKPMIKIILLNGPPKVGKDTIAQGVAEALGGRNQIPYVEKFAQPIRDAAIATFPHVTPENLESLKDLPLYGNGTPTLREWMIAYSERFMKPLMGKAIFGKLLADRIHAKLQESCQLAHWAFGITFLISDAGFSEEPLAVWHDLVKSYGYQVTMHLFHVERFGHDFTGDSRSYISLPEQIATTRPLSNLPGNPESAIKEVLAFI